MKQTLTVTAKRQVTLRKELLQHLGVLPGDKISIELLPSGRAEVKRAPAAGSIEDFIGCLKDATTRSLTLGEIKEITEKSWAGQFDSRD